LRGKGVNNDGRNSGKKISTITRGVHQGGGKESMMAGETKGISPQTGPQPIPNRGKGPRGIYMDGQKERPFTNP